jgi:hypothetical protein
VQFIRAQIINAVIRWKEVGAVSGIKLPPVPHQAEMNGRELNKKRAVCQRANSIGDKWEINSLDNKFNSFNFNEN